MKKLYTNSALLFLVIFFSALSTITAQPGVGISFTFSSAPNVTAFPAGFSTQVVPAANQNDFAYLFSPAGMSVKFAGVNYTQVVIGTNGWVALCNGQAGVPASLSGGSYLNTNSLATYNGGFPLIAPFWDDLASSAIYYNWVGGALWVRWTAKIDATNATAANLFWIRIDGTTGVINFYYPGTAYAVSGPPTASIGIAGVCTGDYYSYDMISTYADSTSETSNLATRPSNLTYTFTPYQWYDDCASAKDLGPLSLTCTPVIYNLNNATNSIASTCTPADVADMWFKVTKPAGVSSVTITTSPASGCQPLAGTTVEVFSGACPGTYVACSAIGTTYPTFGEVTVSRASCVSEVLYIRVTSDGDVGGRFGICAKNAGAVPGTGNTCSNPNWICSLPFSYTGTTAGSVNDYDSTSSACHSIYMNGEDYVLAYTPSSNGCIKIDLTSGGNNPGVFVYQGCPNAVGSTCLMSVEYSTGAGTIPAVGLVAGQTYYIVVDNSILGGNTNIPFTISVTNGGTAPAYDDCTAPYNFGNIALGAPCTPVTLTTSCSNPTAVGAAGVPSCVPAHTPPYFIDGVTGDVWMRFTAVFTGSLLIQTSTQHPNAGWTANAAMAVYTGTCGSFGAPLACDYNSGPNNMPQLSIPVATGTTYFIRVWSEHPEAEGTFDICFQSACAPANDLPCAAVAIPLGATISGFNTCAGSLNEPPNAAQCVAGGTVNTVWFTAIVPASGQVRVRTHPLTLTDTQIQAFLFPTGCVNASTSNTPLACNNDGTACSGGFFSFSEQLYSGLTPGATLYIAVDGVGSNSGSFEVSVIDGASTVFPPVAQQDCGAAQQVCSTADIVVADPGFRNNGNVCDLPGATGCWAIGERNSVWYQFTVDPALTGGTANINYTISSQASVDIDYLMWDITSVSNPCQAIQNGTIGAPTSCNFAAAGATTGVGPPGTGYFSPTITFTGAPRTYLLLLNVYNSATNAGFTLDWTPGANVTPISSTTSSVVWTGLTDNLYATTTNWGDCGATPTCAVDITVNPTANGRQPNVVAGPIMQAKNVLINPGATLTVQTGATLSVCGNFTNLGSLVCQPGSTIQFVGGPTQTISGNLTGANSFANLIINKALPGNFCITNNDIDVSENFTTSSATSVFNLNGYYMKVGKNFTNANGTGTFTGIVSAPRASTVEFNTSNNGTLTNTAGVLNFNKVVMNKTGGAKLSLSGVNSRMNIDSTLTLTSGNIVTTALPTLEVNMKYYLPAALIGGSATSYIEGTLRRKIANGLGSPVIPADYYYPLGDPAVGFNQALIKFTSAATIFDLTGTFRTWPAMASPAAGPTAVECIIATYDLKPIFNNGYWEFKRSTAVVAGNYNVSLFNVGETNNTGSGWTVATAPNTSNPNLIASWGLLGQCVPASTAGNTQRVNFNPTPGTAATSFDHYYATAQTFQNVFLPVELLYFNAEPKGEKVLCSWETSSEVNNDYFDVERSNDGMEFEAIGRVKGFGAGTTTEKHSYSFFDKDLCEDIRYYRLKQVDMDGSFNYSKAIAINCRRSDGIELYPNPANSSITYQFYYQEDADLTLNILDISGRVVRFEKIRVQKGINQLHSLIDDLASGAYTLRISGADDSTMMLQTRFFKN